MDQQNEFENVTVQTGEDLVSEMSQPMQSDAMEIVNRGQNLVQVKNEYVTALRVQKPRDSMSVIAGKLYEEAKLAGSAFYYNWTVTTKDGSKKRVEGGSIDMAMAFLRNFGNCATDVIVVDESPTHWMLKGIVIDLETGTTIPRLYRQRKNIPISKKMDPDRKLDIAFQIGQSKAIRNPVLKIMPVYIRKRAMDMARDAERLLIEQSGIAIAKEKSKEYFSGLGVELSQIENYLGKKYAEWNSRDITELRGVATGIEEGRVSVDEIFVLHEEKQEKKEDTKNHSNGTQTADSQSMGKSEDQPKSKSKRGKRSKNEDKGNDPPQKGSDSQAPENSGEFKQKAEIYRKENPGLYNRAASDAGFPMGGKLPDEAYKSICERFENLSAQLNDKKEQLKDNTGEFAENTMNEQTKSIKDVYKQIQEAKKKFSDVYSEAMKEEGLVSENLKPDEAQRLLKRINLKLDQPNY